MTASEPQHQSFGHYEIERVLGRGAMGTVYLARDQRIGRRVALKTITISPQQFDDPTTAKEFYRRLQREAEVCGSLVHPNIVTLYEAGYQDDRISYLAMEYVEGETLQATMKRARPRPLPLDLSLRIIEEVLRGLSYAHTLNIIHRDIKPGNILIDGEGTAKIADFGIARPQNSSLTGAGALIGTPNYMSPEQVKCSPVTTKSDIFAVGIVMYEMLTGLKPFAGADVSSILRNVVEKNPPPASESNRNVPPAVADFVARLFKKTPEERIASAALALPEIQRLRSNMPAGGDHAEDVTPEHEVATVATGPRGDVTTHSPRAIPAPVFWAITATMLIALSAWSLAIYNDTDPNPEVVITTAKRAEFNAKRQQLSGARRLSAAGRYDEALKAFDAYLEKYPASPAARDDRAATAKRLESAKARSNVVSRAPKARPAPPKVEEPKPAEKKPGWFKRIFGRGDPKKTPDKPVEKPPATKKP